MGFTIIKERAPIFDTSEELEKLQNFVTANAVKTGKKRGNTAIQEGAGTSIPGRRGGGGGNTIAMSGIHALKYF